MLYRSLAFKECGMQFTAARQLARATHFTAARQFANREQELQAVEQRVSALIQGADVKECIINLHGVPGIGKTALFAELESIYRAVEQIVVVALSLAGLMADIPTTDLPNAKQRFLQCFLDQLPQPIKQSIQPELDQSAAEGTLTEAQINTTLSRCAESLRQLDQPLLLLIDAWEDVPETLFSWVERTFLLPLVQPTRCICVLGSQSELRWRQFDVRRRARPYPLQALDRSATQKQTQTETDTELGGLIFRITAGHPYASEVVFQRLQAGSADTDWLRQHASTVAELVVDELQRRVRGALTQELQDLLGVIALFREFDVNTLRNSVSQFVPALKNRSQSALLLSIKQLLETQFVSWNDGIRAYQLDPTIRKIFAYAVELKDRGRFVQIHAAAASYYEGLIRDVPGNRNVYLVEFYYHTLYKGSEDLYNAEEVSRTFQTFLAKYYTNRDGSLVNPSLLERLREQLEDEELQSVFAAHKLPPTLLVDIVSQKLETSTLAVSVS
jgi:hypothetical protein